VLYSKDSTTGENMNDHLKEWAEERAIKQTKLPKKTWIKQSDGTSRALVELVRDKDGCVVRIEPAPVQEPIGHIFIEECGEGSWFPFVCKFGWTGDLLSKLGTGRHAVFAAAQPAPETLTFDEWYSSAIWGNEDFKEGCRRAWNASRGQDD